jgi:hypothetical protein
MQAHSELAQEKGQKIDLQKELDRKNKEIFTLSQVGAKSSLVVP